MSERLVEAGTKAFAARGFEGASTHAIAKAARAPQGLVRHHFGSKDGLWLAVVDRGLATMVAELEAEPGRLTVAAWMAIVERHVELVAVLVHGLLEGGARAALAAEKVVPVLERLRNLQRAAQPQACEAQLWMWLAASLAAPLVQRVSSAEAAPLRTGDLDLLFAWLCTTRAPRAAGPFALNAARSHLRGTG